MVDFKNGCQDLARLFPKKLLTPTSRISLGAPTAAAEFGDASIIAPYATPPATAGASTVFSICSKNLLWGNRGRTYCVTPSPKKAPTVANIASPSLALTAPTKGNATVEAGSSPGKTKGAAK